MEGGEPSGVGGVQFGARGRQQSDRLAVAFPGGLVQSAVAVLRKNMEFEGEMIQWLISIMFR